MRTEVLHESLPSHTAVVFTWHSGGGGYVYHCVRPCGRYAALVEEVDNPLPSHELHLDCLLATLKFP